MVYRSEIFGKSFLLKPGKALEEKLKALEDQGKANSVSLALQTLHRTLDKSRFDLEEVMSDLESLTRLARLHNNPKAREYECVLAELVQKHSKTLSRSALKYLFVALIGDPIRSKILEKLNKILKNIKVPDERLGPSLMGYRENPVL
ncbi:hypothetical protein QZH41_015300 [Actinostola sp. cb2023]|nr:hypothetical protein QZH41_015300 [Actinostola sp. cb2023]